MNKVNTIIIVVLSLLALITVYQCRNSKIEANSKNPVLEEETINSRKFFKKWAITKHLPQAENEDDYNHLLRSSSGLQSEIEDFPEILSYGVNILLEVDNQSKQENVDEVNSSTRVTAQCDVQTIYDDEFNVFDIAVSYTMVYTHDIDESESGIHFDLENSQEKLRQEENVNLESDYYEKEEIEDFEVYEESPIQNYFYKLLVHGDSGEVISMQIEINVEENQMITYATQQLISDIFPDLKKSSYENGSVETDNMGLFKSEYKQEQIDEENILIRKQYDQDDYVKNEAPGIETEINFERNVVMDKSTGIVKEGNTDYKFVLGEINEIKLMQNEENNDEEEDVEALGQISGEMKCNFWEVPAAENNEEISREMFRYRSETSVFEEVRLAKDIKAEIQYGDGQEQQFELVDIDEEDEIEIVDDNDFSVSEKSPVYFDMEGILEEKQNKERRNLQVAIGNYKRTNLTFITVEEGRRRQEEYLRRKEAEMREKIRQAEEAKRREEERLRIEAEKARQEELKRQEEARIAQAMAVVQEFKEMDQQLSVFENILEAKIQEKLRKDLDLENARKMQENVENSLEKINEEYKNVQFELKQLQEIKGDLINSKNVIQGQITRQIMDVKKAVNKSALVYEQMAQKEMMQVMQNVGVLESILKENVENVNSQVLQGGVANILGIFVQIENQVNMVKNSFDEEKEKLENLIEKVEEIRNSKVLEVQEKLVEETQLILQEVQQKVNEQIGQIQIENQLVQQVNSISENIRNQEFHKLPDQLRNQVQGQFESLVMETQRDLQVKMQEFVGKNEEIQQILEITQKFREIDVKMVENNVKIQAQQQIENNKNEIKQKALQEMEIAKNQVKIAMEEQFAAEIAMFEAEKAKIAEAEQVVEELKLVKYQIENFPENAKQELEKIKQEAVGTAKEIIEDKIQELVDLDQFRYPANNDNPETFRETQTLGKVRILGKEIGIDLVYQGYVEESDVALKLRVGEKYIATAMQQGFSNCSGQRNDKMTTKDFIFFQATFPILGIIVIPVKAGGRIQYGYTSGVTSGPRYCSFQLSPQFKAGLYAEGAISLAGLISAGVYAQGNFLDTKLTLEATTDHGKSFVGLKGEFHAYSVEMGATYTKISCSLKNVTEGRMLASENQENDNEVDLQERRVLLRKAFKKIKKVVKKVVHTVKNVANVVYKAAYKISDAVQKAYKIVINLHKICSKSKGSIAICKFEGKSKQRQIFYKSINVGL